MHSRLSKISKLILLLLVFNSSVFSILILGENSDSSSSSSPYFNLTLLVPNSCPVRTTVSSIVKAELTEIGINVSIYAVGWNQIMPRTFEYPVGTVNHYSYIPSFDEGGYDFMSIGWGWDFEWNPKGLFDTASIVPNGDNFYQYSNTTFDNTLQSYLKELNYNKMIQYSHKLQAILHSDLPSIPLVYPYSEILLSKNVSNISANLLFNHASRTEYWQKENNNSFSLAMPSDFYFDSYFDKYLFDHELMLLNPVLYGLFGRSPINYSLEPLLADSYFLDSSSLSLTVKINNKAFFSNGDPVTADDVAYTYQVYLSPETNFRDYDRLVEFLSTNDSIQVIDNRTVKFTFSKPYAFYLSLLLYPIFNKNLLSQYITENGYNFDIKNDNISEALFTGAGPYQLNISEINNAITVQHNEVSNVTLYLNPYWQINKPNIKTITFQMVKNNLLVDKLQNGEIDGTWGWFYFSKEDINALSSLYNIIEIPRLSTKELAINMKHPIIGTGELTPKGTSDAARFVRQAISYSISRKVIINESYDGLAKAASSPMPDGCIGYDKSLKPYTYNLTYAKKLMGLAGYEEKMTTSPIPMSFTIMIFACVTMATTLIITKKSIFTKKSKIK